jgi:hypothetical protein
MAVMTESEHTFHLYSMLASFATALLSVVCFLAGFRLSAPDWFTTGCGILLLVSGVACFFFTVNVVAAGRPWKTRRKE